eukprot:624257-Pelagomonas_calceolata.AAC.5
MTCLLFNIREHTCNLTSRRSGTEAARSKSWERILPDVSRRQQIIARTREHMLPMWDRTPKMKQTSGAHSANMKADPARCGQNR